MSRLPTLPILPMPASYRLVLPCLKVSIPSEFVTFLSKNLLMCGLHQCSRMDLTSPMIPSWRLESLNEKYFEIYYLGFTDFFIDLDIIKAYHA
jgi:hypothetical protein